MNTIFQARHMDELIVQIHAMNPSVKANGGKMALKGILKNNALMKQHEPFFENMTRQQIGLYFNKYTAHHLRQFSC